MTLDELVPFMPHFQAVLNAACLILLIAGYASIRHGKRSLHRGIMATALTLSVLFMVSYLTYHARVGYAPFAGQGWIRPVYFSFLASHVILAAVIVPMVLSTVYFAVRGNFTRHPAVARWTLPAWLYVSFSGVLVYVLGFHLYKPA